MASCPFCKFSITIMDDTSAKYYLSHVRWHEMNGDVELRLKGDATAPAKRIAAWRIVDKHGDVICFGIEDEPNEFPLDRLPGGWDGDRNIDEVQKAMEIMPLWEKENYKFQFILLDLGTDLVIKRGGA